MTYNIIDFIICKAWNDSNANILDDGSMYKVQLIINCKVPTANMYGCRHLTVYDEMGFYGFLCNLCSTPLGRTEIA